MSTSEIRDYSLLGEESKLSIERGLVDAEWYSIPVSREKMKELLIRRNGPAIRDTILWFTLIIGSGFMTYFLWGQWTFIFPYFIYTVLYASTSDSRWHESSHGTAFKTPWMNNALYEIASFMVFRQSVTWRWSHTRHHSDTIIRGRDPEIAVPRPANLRVIILNFFAIRSSSVELIKIVKHAFGKIDPAVATYVPQSDYGKVFVRARIYLGIYVTVIILSEFLHSILPLMFIGIPTLVGSWLLIIYGLTQHAGLAENVTDHRLNSRTVYMNRLNRYLYWNMGYHLEHHMFPLVPYHALPALHELIKHDCPKPYNGIADAYKEIIPTLIKQSKDASFYIKRELPNQTTHIPAQRFIGNSDQLKDGWIEVCPVDALARGDVVRFDFLYNTYAIYHTDNDKFYATDGICTHGNAHLADGLVIGNIIECAKHNGRFNLTDGTVLRQPVSVGLRTYKVKIENNNVLINIRKEGTPILPDEKMYRFKVVSNKNKATFIKELVLEQFDGDLFTYMPGDYIKLEIPPYESDLKHVDVDEPFRSRWQYEFVYDHFARNTLKSYRNYSMASNPRTDKLLKFNIRLSLPPAGQNYSAGVGSSYAFNLKEGDIVTLTGPFGSFHIKDNENEIVYIGGGAGMAPIKSHISYLFDTLNTSRKVSYWYGARSKMELFYDDYFYELEKNQNFKFNVALSEPLPNDNWNSYTGFIHQVLNDEYLSKLENIRNIEFYLCGPPAMIKASLKMLKELNVNDQQISYDEF